MLFDNTIKRSLNDISALYLINTKLQRVCRNRQIMQIKNGKYSYQSLSRINTSATPIGVINRHNMNPWQNIPLPIDGSAIYISDLKPTYQGANINIHNISAFKTFHAVCNLDKVDRLKEKQNAPKHGEAALRIPQGPFDQKRYVGPSSRRSHPRGRSPLPAVWCQYLFAIYMNQTDDCKYQSLQSNLLGTFWKTLSLSAQQRRELSDKQIEIRGKYLANVYFSYHLPLKGSN